MFREGALKDLAKLLLVALSLGLMVGAWGCSGSVFGVDLGEDDDPPPLPPLFVEQLQVQPNSGGVIDLALHDLDGDGDLDLVVADAWEKTKLMVNDGTGQFTLAGILTTPNTSEFVFNLSVGDFDGDGDADVILGTRKIMLNQGDGTFVESAHSPGSNLLEPTLVGDLDGDDDLDLIFCEGGAPPRVYLNDGAGVFTDSGQVVGTVCASDWALGDLDADGDLDVVLTVRDHPFYILLNDGSGVFTAAGSVGVPEDFGGLALGDMDGDGDLDLVEVSTGTKIWFNDGNAAFTDSGQVLGPVALSVSTGDLDGDGDQDIVVGNFGPDQVFLNDGSGLFTDLGYGFGSTQTANQALGDLDGDGDLDLVVGRGSDFGVWLNAW